MSPSGAGPGTPDGGEPARAAGLEPSTTPALHPDRSPARQFLGLIAIGAAIGAPAAVVAKVFLAVVHWAEDWLWTDLPDALGESSPPWYLVLGLPVAGAALVVVARRFLPGDGGHSPLHGLGGPPTPWQYGPSVLLAAFGTLAFGAVLGPEAPLIALGSVIGMAAARWARPGPQGEQVLATAGSFSAVSALFGGPLVAGILLLEAGLAAGAALLPALLPGLVAAAVGYVLFIGLGDWGGLDEASLVVPDLPDYDTTSVPDLLMALVVGVLTAVLIGVVKQFAHRVDGVASRSPRSTDGVLLAGGLAIGLITLAAQALGADYDEVLFSGQSAIPQELAENSASVLLVILVAKALAYAVCLGCGFRGGPVFPAVFLGVGIASFACIWFDTSITWALAVGAAAGMTAGTGLVFSGLVLSLLLVGVNGEDALPAAVLAVVAAWLTNAALTRRAEQHEPA
jgi:H+/Cl- antiporter ClcA